MRAADKAKQTKRAVSLPAKEEGNLQTNVASNSSGGISRGRSLDRQTEWQSKATHKPLDITYKLKHSKLAISTSHSEWFIMNLKDPLGPPMELL